VPSPKRRAKASAPRGRSSERVAKLPDPVALELAKALPPSKTAKMAKRLVDASRAFQDDRYQDTLRILRPVLAETPDVPAVRELAGLALYRQGKWAKAAEQLEAFRDLTGSEEQNPVLADAYRALGRHKKVDELWNELRQASPGIALLTEGRIVAAGSLADRGDLPGAIGLLSRGPVVPRRTPEDHHVRLWYALADLYERSGDAPRARELFRRVADVEPDLADTAERLAALG
jgi:tetratricopeptide (TPR) repeat protein